jgi:hypothetical protein
MIQILPIIKSHVSGSGNRATYVTPEITVPQSDERFIVINFESGESTKSLGNVINHQSPFTFHLIDKREGLVEELYDEANEVFKGLEALNSYGEDEFFITAVVNHKIEKAFVDEAGRVVLPIMVTVLWEESNQL